MPDEILRQLCKDLAMGPKWEVEAAWQRLARQEEFWQRCMATFQRATEKDTFDPEEELFFLADCFDLIACPPESVRANLVAIGLPVTEAARLQTAAARIVASAYVAVVARLACRGQRSASDMIDWAGNAVRGEHSLEVHFDRPEITWPSASGGERALTVNCFRLLAKQLPLAPDAIASAQTATLRLLDLYTAERRLPGIPILLVGCDHLARLSVKLVPDGFGQLVPSPSMFRVFDTKWHDALRTAFDRQRPVASHTGQDVVWEITAVPKVIEGESALALAQAAMQLLRIGGRFDSKTTISATVDDAGRLGHVEGLVGENGVPGPKLVAAASGGLKRVVICKANHASLSASAIEEMRERGVAIDAADTLDEAIDLASGLLTEMEQLLTGILRHDVLDDAERRIGRDIRFPDWSSFDRLFVPVRVARGLRPKLSEQEYRELEQQRTQGDWRGINELEKRKLDLRKEQDFDRLPQSSRSASRPDCSRRSRPSLPCASGVTTSAVRCGIRGSSRESSMTPAGNSSPSMRVTTCSATSALPASWPWPAPTRPTHRTCSPTGLSANT